MTLCRFYISHIPSTRTYSEMNIDIEQYSNGNIADEIQII